MKATIQPAIHFQIAADGPLTFDIGRKTSHYTGVVHLQTSGRMDRIAFCGALLSEQRMIAHRLTEEDLSKYVTCKACDVRRRAGENRTKIDETMPYDKTS